MRLHRFTRRALVVLAVWVTFTVGLSATPAGAVSGGGCGRGVRRSPTATPKWCQCVGRPHCVPR
jgi:hypothetical protein